LHPGDRLKKFRTHLGITTREVTEMSERIARAEGNEEFYISNAWLTQVENTDATPSIYKLFSLSVIYHVKFAELLNIFGVDLLNIGKHQMATPLEQTHLANVDVGDSDRTVTFPVRFDSGFNLEKTNLLSRMVELWGQVPIALIQHLDLRHNLYGYIGLTDNTLSPMLKPGSFVQINQKSRKVQTFKWRTEFDRPIYFVELRDGYACSWCEQQGSQLTLVPHPLSQCAVRRFVYGNDAEIVGQVTGVAMRIADTTGSGALPEPPR